MIVLSSRKETTRTLKAASLPLKGRRTSEKEKAFDGDSAVDVSALQTRQLTGQSRLLARQSLFLLYSPSTTLLLKSCFTIPLLSAFQSDSSTYYVLEDKKGFLIFLSSPHSKVETIDLQNNQSTS